MIIAEIALTDFWKLRKDLLEVLFRGSYSHIVNSQESQSKREQEVI